MELFKMAENQFSPVWANKDYPANVDYDNLRSWNWSSYFAKLFPGGHSKIIQNGGYIADVVNFVFFTFSSTTSVFLNRFWQTSPFFKMATESKMADNFHFPLNQSMPDFHMIFQDGGNLQNGGFTFYISIFWNTFPKPC
jgi:hypothetical protein